jgi:poly(beta-D-mannuronate) lyase
MGKAVALSVKLTPVANMKKVHFTHLLLSVILFVGFAGQVTARELRVETQGQLASALKTAGANDVIILKDGEWKDTKLAIKQGGLVGRPLVIHAENPGAVKFSGTSSLEINAPYVIVDGFLFAEGSTQKGAVIQFNSHHGIVRNTAIVDYNPKAFETEYYWVFFAGDYNVIERCYFKGKNNLQPLIGNAIEDSRYNTVRDSYFKNIPYVANANGREIIRVWGSGKIEDRDEDGAYFTIENNLFDHAHGEGTEIISLKSNHNIVQGNTIIATRGGVNIRRGNFNTVRGNQLLGQGYEGAQGLRMSGRDNIVAGNFVSGCEYGIRVACGEYITSSLTPSYTPDVKPNGKKTAQVRIPTYPQVLRLSLVDNVTIGISGPDLEVGSAYKNHWPVSQQVLVPEDCMIKNNRFIRTGSGGDAVIVTVPEIQPPFDRFTFKSNRYEGNTLVGVGTIATPAQSGFTVQPASFYNSKIAQAATAPLSAEQVGPAWVIARRRAGDWAVEDSLSEERPAAASEVRKKKKNR